MNRIPQGRDVRVSCGEVFEQSLEAAGAPGDPLDVVVDVQCSGPDGAVDRVGAFWIGGGTWRFRLRPGKPGRWHWKTTCQSDASLHGREGELVCTSPVDCRGLGRCGSPTVSRSGTHLVRADGTQWLWLADTAWSGALLAEADDWRRYLEDRRAKGFTAIQLLSLPWMAAPTDCVGQTAYTRGHQGLQLNPAFFQRMDRRIAAVAAAGLVPVVVMFWAAPRSELNPGVALSEADLIALGRYQLARWSCYGCIWMLAGDGKYDQSEAEVQRWSRVGRAIFARHPEALASLHPWGMTWPAESFREEPWYRLVGYQSGHDARPSALRWLTSGSPVGTESHHPPLPVINLEPAYEGLRALAGRRRHIRHDDRTVRRAMYWSLLAGPVAGVSYGAHGLWSWQTERGVPPAHASTGVAPPWWEAMEMPGSQSVRHLATLLASLDWWKLRPAHGLLLRQPGARRPRRFVAAACAEDQSFALIYTPAGGRLRVRCTTLPATRDARWFNPRTGVWLDGPAALPDQASVRTPDRNDWILWIGTESTAPR